MEHIPIVNRILGRSLAATKSRADNPDHLWGDSS